MEDNTIEKEYIDDLIKLVEKYRLKLNAGQIVECTIGYMTHLASIKAYKTRELDELQLDLFSVISKTINNAKEYFKKNEMNNGQ